MGYELIITEKPSAAKKIANALADSTPTKKSNKGVPYYELNHNGKPVVVGCAVGHLYTVTEKKKSFTYPSFDIEWKPTYSTDKSAKYSKKYLSTLKQLAKDASAFTVACDYDIEGEVIGLNCVRFACKKDDAARMKFSTLTKPDLVESYEKKQGSLDWGQAYAGETRHILDWLYGINLSRALTLALKKAKIYKVLSSGRVQGPALKLIVEKELDINKFVPKKYWQIELNGEIKQGNITAWHKEDKFWEEKNCDIVLQKVRGKNGKIADVKTNEFKQAPPYPFDLTTLQTESYRVFRIPPKRTLQIAQELYQNSLISYPRTSSQQLSPKIGFKSILGKLSSFSPEYKKLTDKLLAKKVLRPNNGKKTDPAHPAIYPTGYNNFKFNSYQKKVYDLIVKRFFATFGEWARRETNVISIDVEEESFLAKGTRTTEKGWHIFYDPYVRLKEEELPKVNKEDPVKVKKLVKHEKETEPPKRYTPASIIKELEKRNLGTKSTRAQIIESLYSRDYVEDKSLRATSLGIKIIDVLEKYSPKIIDEELTRQFQEEMDEIRKDKKSPEKIIQKAKSELKTILDDFKDKEKKIGEALKEAYKDAMTTEIGTCKVCNKGTLVIKSSRKTKQRFIACDSYPDCKTIYSIPQKGKVRSSGKECEECGFPLITINNRKKQTVCFNPKCPTMKIDKDLVKKDKASEDKTCPKCKKGKLVLRKSVYGEFYGCSNYPKCRYTEKISK